MLIYLAISALALSLFFALMFCWGCALTCRDMADEVAESQATMDEIVRMLGDAVDRLEEAEGHAMEWRRKITEAN